MTPAPRSPGSARQAAERSAEPTLHISLLNDLRELARVAAEIDEMCSEQQLGSRIGYAVQLCVEEMLTHIISDGYSDDAQHRIHVSVHVDEAELLVLVVNEGHELAGLRAGLEAKSLLSGAPSLDDAGLEQLGLALVHQVMDEVACERHERCNVVAMTKLRTAEPEPEPRPSPAT